MKKLKTFKIRNFQSIENADIELGNITVFYGESRKGKSACLRAAQAVAENRNGVEFITWGKKKAEVWLGDGTNDIGWVQSKSLNDYYIDKERFQNVGKSIVPEEVQEILNMRVLEFGKDIKKNLNFSKQLGGIFLVEGKGSDNAKVIGSITNLHKIYNGLRDAEKDTKNIKKQVTLLTKQVKEQEELAEQKDEEYAWISKRYDICKELYDRTQEIEKRVEVLVELRRKYQEVTKEEAEKKARYEILKKVDIKAGIKKTEMIGALSYMKMRYEALEKEESKFQARRSVLKGIDIKANIIGVDRIIGLNSIQVRYKEIERIEAESKPRMSALNKIDIKTSIDNTDRLEALIDIRTKYGALEAQKATSESLMIGLKGFSAEKHLNTLERLERLLKLKSERNTINDIFNITTKNLEAVSLRIGELQEELDSIETCSSCGALKEHWNL